MTNFFSNFDVVLAKPEELSEPAFDIETKDDGLGGYLVLVNRGSDYFRDIFGDQREFTKYERQQLKLFAIGAFLRRDTLAREKFLPGVDTDGVDVAIARLTEEAYLHGEL